jgi:asparagine synthase (glutamine-hydrolysing)
MKNKKLCLQQVNMCGLFGYMGSGRNGRLGLALLRRRGPDGMAYWQDDDSLIWLGHARLAIQDVSEAGSQPMHDPSGRYTMIYNGEIYNAPELRRELQDVGEKFVGHSDTEVLLRLFSIDGPNCFARLNGIYAAAIWDSKANELIVVRDAMGVKPLYIDRRDGGFAFASEMKALVRTLDITPVLNRSAALCHLVYLWSPGEETIVEGISKLLPGQYLVRSVNGNERVCEYADPSLPPVQKCSVPVDQMVTDTANMVKTAIERQLLSDVTVGAFLSGGLDSSSIVAFASKKLQEQGGDGLPCFSISLRDTYSKNEGFVDDLTYAKRVAEHLGVELTAIEIGPEVVARLSELIYYLDEPNADPAPLNSLCISEVARANGIKVLLSGTGGDDIFTGYRRHVALSAERYWSNLPAIFRKGIKAVTTRLPRTKPLTRRIAKAFEYADRPAAERIIRYFQWLDPDEAFALFSESARQNLTRSGHESIAGEYRARRRGGFTLG